VTRSSKILLLGDIGVGKTSLAKRFVFDSFDADYKTTIGVDILTHDIALGPDCNDAAMRLVLWDTDGDFGDRIFASVYALGSQGAIIVADATRPNTLTHMSDLAAEFSDRFPGRPMCAIINKIDLVAPADRNFKVDGMDREEILLGSALTGEGVEPLFRSLGEAIWRRS
jgi:Ras-related protein Rab-5C